MNIETANIRAHKIVIEDEVGLKLIIIPRSTGRTTYELHDGEGKFIKDSRQLKTILNFISIYFNYSYSLLEENINLERIRLIKENNSVLKSARHDAQTLLTREKQKKIPKNKSKPKKRFKTKCPHCEYHKCIIKSQKKGFFIQYECKNCLRSHIRDPNKNIIKGDKRNIVKNIITENISPDIIDIIIEDNNINI